MLPKSILHLTARGNHFVMRNSDNRVEYYLIDNAGAIVRSATFALGENVRFPSITSYNSVLHVVFWNEVMQRIQLYKSSNAGVTWTDDDFRTTVGAVGSIDSYKDFRGVHIVYGSSAGIRYFLRQPEGVWATFSSEVTSQDAQFAAPQILAHKDVTTGTDSAHILAGFQATSNQRLFSFYFPPSGAGSSWQARDCPGTSKADFLISSSQETQEKHIYVLTVSTSNVYHWTTRSYDAPSGWSFLGLMTNAQANSGPDAALAFTYPYHYPSFVRSEGGNRIIFSAFIRAGFTTPSRIEAELGIGGPPVISSNLTGLAIAWRGANGNLHFTRKAFGISGLISENYDLSGENWFVAEATVAPGKTLTLKSGSTTHVWHEFQNDADPSPPHTFFGPGKLVVATGGALVIEEGAMLILENSTVQNIASGILELHAPITLIGDGAELVAKEGSQLRFGSGSVLKVAGTGKLTVIGTATKPVVFNRAGTTGSWGGLSIKDYANVSLAYARFHNLGTIHVSSTAFSMTNCVVDTATVGLDFGPSLTTPEPLRTVQNSRFSNITNAAVVLNNFSNLLMTHDTIDVPSGTSATGIACVASSPRILNTIVKEYKYGLECSNQSAPILENGLFGGFNRFINNEMGGVFTGGSNAILGAGTGPPTQDEGGQNSIYNNSSFFLLTLAESDLYAENNWWGSKFDPGMRFIVDDVATIDYSPWLFSNPNPTESFTDPPDGNEPMTESMAQVLVRRAIDQRSSGEYAMALGTLKTVVASVEATLRQKKWALGQMLAVSPHIPGVNLSAYLRPTFLSQPALTRQIKAMLPIAYTQEKDPASAISAYEENMSQYAGTSLHRSALYGKFIHALHTIEDTVSAEQLQALISRTYGESLEARLASAQLRVYRESMALPRGSHSVDPEIPNGNALHQNYPNPFNPSTILSFTVPRSLFVTLKVYNILGQEVRTLVTGMMVAGTHRVEFDAAGLPGGVYIYKLQAPGYTESRKMLLLR